MRKCIGWCELNLVNQNVGEKIKKRIYTRICIHVHISNNMAAGRIVYVIELIN